MPRRTRGARLVGDEEKGNGEIVNLAFEFKRTIGRVGNIFIVKMERIDLVYDSASEPIVCLHPPINNPIAQLGQHFPKSRERPAMMRHFIFCRQSVQGEPFGFSDIFTRR